MVGDNESFASRWSRRKHQVAEEEIRAKELKLEDELDNKDELDPNLPKELTPEEKLAELNALTDEDMPGVETLDEESDYSGFMSANVSEGLRKMALSKLFHGKSYNVRDGLDEYDGDYTFFEKLDPNTITSDMHHMIEVEAKRALAKKEQEEEEKRLSAEAESIEAESVDGLDELDEFDEFADDIDEDDVELAVSSDTSEDSSTNSSSNKEEKIVEAQEINKNDSTNEEVA